MKVTQLNVQIGGRKVLITDREFDDPNLQELLRMAKFSSVTIEIILPNSSDSASALGRIYFEADSSSAQIKSDTNIDMIAALSQRIDGIGLTTRTRKSLVENAKLVYVWQVVKMTEWDLMKIKNFGRKSLCEVGETIKEMGLTFGMDLLKIQDQLPHP